MSIEEINLQFLEKPEIEEALNGELDWHALNGKNFNAIIKNLPSDAVGKELKLTWLGTNSDEEELDPEHKKHIIQWSDIFNDLTIELENDLAKAVVGGSAVIDYEIEPDLKSPQLNITVIDGTPVTPEPELNAPEVTEAIGSALSPDRVKEDGATVLIKTVAPIVEGDEILLKVVATDAKGTPIVLEPPAKEAGQDDTEFRIDKDLLKAIAGGSLKLHYTVKGETSPTLELSVDYGIIPPELDGIIDPQETTPIKIVVPHYEGMSGDSISLSIELPNLSYRSSPQIAKGVNNLQFNVPFGVFVAAFNYFATVTYEVTRTIDEDNKEQWSSHPLIIPITGYVTNIRPPQYMSFAGEAPTYTVNYAGVTGGDTVEVYWQAEDKPLKSMMLTVKKDKSYYYVDIPKIWATDDRNKTICGNYSLPLGSGNLRQFSPGSIFKP
jgi:hypothetical protein